jgi:hypothetical protein
MRRGTCKHKHGERVTKRTRGELLTGNTGWKYPGWNTGRTTDRNCSSHPSYSKGPRCARAILCIVLAQT